MKREFGKILTQYPYLNLNCHKYVISHGNGDFLKNNVPFKYAPNYPIYIKLLIQRHLSIFFRLLCVWHI